MIRYESGFVEFTQANAPVRVPLSEILEQYNPFYEYSPGEIHSFYESLALSHDIHQSAFSPFARSVLRFWKSLHRFEIKTIAGSYLIDSNQKKWEWTLSPDGLLFKDCEEHLHHYIQDYHQTFSDFYFFGPRVPMTDPDVKMLLLQQIDSGLKDRNFIDENHGFKVFDYPEISTPQLWEEGDWRSGSFVRMCSYGVEYGSTNWRDGLMFLSFISFEQILNRTDIPDWAISRDILHQIKTFLLTESGGLKIRDRVAVQMEQYIVKRQEEKKELLQQETLLDSPGYRQDKSLELWENGKDEAAIPLLLSLLDEEDIYWSDHVFSRMIHMYESPGARDFMLQCLDSDDDRRYSKVVSVIQLWSMQHAQGTFSHADFRQINIFNRQIGSKEYQDTLQKIKQWLLAMD